MKRQALVVTAVVITLAVLVAEAGLGQAARAVSYTLLEVLAALALTALGAACTALATPATRRWLDAAVTRGLEVTGALPVVLLAICVYRGVSTSLLVALVVGSLGALRAARVALRHPLHTADRLHFPSWLARRPLWLTTALYGLQASITAVPAQVVGLGAALTWLGWAPASCDWGGRLGQLAERGQRLSLVPYVLGTVLLSLSLQAVYKRWLTAPR